MVDEQKQFNSQNNQQPKPALPDFMRHQSVIPPQTSNQIPQQPYHSVPPINIPQQNFQSPIIKPIPGIPAKILPPKHRHSSVGPLIGIIIILIVLLVGALYMWGQQLDKIKKAEELQKNTATTTTRIIKIN